MAIDFQPIQDTKSKIQFEPIDTTTRGGRLVRDLTRTPARLLAQGAGVLKSTGQLLGGNVQGAQETIDRTLAGTPSKYYGDLKPIGTDGSFQDRVKESVGVGLEMASYLPITRAATAPLHAGQAAFQAGRKELLQKGATPFIQGTKQFGKDVLKSAKPLAIEGGAGASVFETGRQLQEDGALDPIRIATAGGIGLGTGGALGLLGGVSGAFGSRAANRLDDWKNIWKPSEENIPLIKDRLARSFETAFSESSGIRGKLDKISHSINRNLFGKEVPEQGATELLNNIAKSATEESGQIFDRSKLFNELFDNKFGVFLPEVDGVLANSTPAKSMVKGTITNLAKQRDAIYDFYKNSSITPDELLSITLKEIENTPIKRGEFGNVTAEIGRIVDDFKKSGATLNPRELQSIITDMGKKSKAFVGNNFEQDAKFIVYKSAKDAMSKIIPPEELAKVTALTDDMSQLIRIDKTLGAIHSQKIRVPYSISKLGSLGAIMTLGGLLGSMSSVGTTGGLVVAGMLANYGDKFVSDIVRKSIFNKGIQDVLKAGLRESPDLLQIVSSSLPKAEQQAFIRQIQQFDIEDFKKNNKDLLGDIRQYIIEDNPNVPLLIDGIDYTPQSRIMLPEKSEMNRGIREVMSPQAAQGAERMRQGRSVRDILQLPAPQEGSATRLNPTVNQTPIPQQGVTDPKRKRLIDILGM